MQAKKWATEVALNALRALLRKDHSALVVALAFLCESFQMKRPTPPKKATISATDTATKNIANAVTALAGGNNGGSGNGNGSGSGDTGNNPVAGNADNAGGNDSTAGNKPSRKIVVAGNEPLSRTGAEATVIASVALSLALTAAGALALSRNRGDAAAAQALSDSTRPTSAR
mgnify:CR=1 FL=1